MMKRTLLERYRRGRKFKEIQRLRQWKRDFIAEENDGRCRQIIWERPEICRVHTCGGWTSTAEITLRDGWEAFETHSWPQIALLNCALVVYYELVRRVLNKGSE